MRPHTARTTPLLSILAVTLLALAGASARPAYQPPEVSPQTRPWTRWWWMGSAVTPAGITAELQALKDAGIGGVEITPIYGVRGTEDRFVPYLSPDWVALLEHALAEARRLGLGVDMATGTGWPFGGPWVRADDACRTLVLRTYAVGGGERLGDSLVVTQEPLLRAIGGQVYQTQGIYRLPDSAAGAGRDQPPAGARTLQIADLIDPVEANPNLQALAIDQVRFPKQMPRIAVMAYGESGEALDLTDRVGADGHLDWVAPSGAWTVYAAFQGWHGKMVERAAPGGEGNVIDHFAAGPIRRYLARFDRAFGDRPLRGLRAFFNDSYEVDDAAGQADWTPALFEEFRARRGYDLRRHLPALMDRAGADENARVLADYRETISDLLLETFTTDWRTWASARGALIRNQAHGSPANLLDLYAASDIPETEGVHIARFKWASSAAHVAGRRLVAAEAATWLGEHFRSPLADVRRAADEYFLGGVNHLVYHGTNYSPEEAEWPGWLFYAAVHFNPRNSWWGDLPALNAYVTRVQSYLQAGRPDHDVLLYYPEYDVLTVRSPRGLLEHFGGDQAVSRGTPFEAVAKALQERGFTHDFISDRQLQTVSVSEGRLSAGAGAGGAADAQGRYRILVLPHSRYLHLQTLERAVQLARDGATVAIAGDFPGDVAGLGDLQTRRARFHALRDGIRFGAPDSLGIREAAAGRGRFLMGPDVERLLDRAGVRRETMVDQGLQFARRAHADGWYYFVANRGGVPFDDWVSLATSSKLASLVDPMTGRTGAALLRSSPDRLQVRLQLQPGESLVIATHASGAAGGTYPYYSAVGPSHTLGGPWRVDFVAGGPELPAARTIERLGSWTDFEGEEVKSFSGTAVFSISFARPASRAEAWRLDLGRVAHSARVRLNGQALGTLIGPGYAVDVEAVQLRDSNDLSISVSNLMANRIADLDRRGVLWKKFYNVNFPARLPQNRGPDGLFTAAKWTPLESGLPGPVTLTPLARITANSE